MRSDQAGHRTRHLPQLLLVVVMIRLNLFLLFTLLFFLTDRSQAYSPTPPPILEHLSNQPKQLVSALTRLLSRLVSVELLIERPKDG